MKTTLVLWLHLAVGLFLAAALPLAPHAAMAAAHESDMVSVAAVNYTGNEMSEVLFFDAKDPKKVAGGPPLSPYGGSGGMCCISLPRKWHPGILVKVRYAWFREDNPYDDRFLTVELPPYPTDEPGTLWALFYEDGTTEVFASAVDPGHPKWPGKVKHWPVPSREYKLKLWQMEYNRIARLESYYKQMISGLTPSQLSSSWHTTWKIDKKELLSFTGPDDPAFYQYLKTQGAKELAEMYERLRRLEADKP